MRVCLITSARPRHIAAAEILDRAGHRLDVLVDAPTAASPRKLSPCKTAYFDQVTAAEGKLYGKDRPWPRKTSVQRLSPNDGGVIPDEAITEANIVVLYGCRYFSGDCLADLRERRALSVHLGISPYYLGNGANFWAAYDGHPDLIGASLHRVDRFPDAGPVVFYSRPDRPDPSVGYDYFDHAMASVGTVFADLARLLSETRPAAIPALESRGPVLHHSGTEDFTDAIVTEFLARRKLMREPDYAGIVLPDVADALDRHGD